MSKKDVPRCHARCLFCRVLSCWTAVAEAMLIYFSTDSARARLAEQQQQQQPKTSNLAMQNHPIDK